MGDWLGHLLLLGQFLFPVAGILCIAVVVFRLTALFAGSRGHPSGSGPAEPPEVPAQRRAAGRTGWWIALAGLGLPWLVGLVVKLVLDAAGEPTHPIASFLHPSAVAVLLAATAIHWCSPLLLLAAWIRSPFFTRFPPGLTFANRMLVARLTAAGGLAAGVPLFARLFRDWNTIFIFVPVGVGLLPGMFVGGGIGWLVVRRRNRSKAAR